MNIRYAGYLICDPKGVESYTALFLGEMKTPITWSIWPEGDGLGCQRLCSAVLVTHKQHCIVFWAKGNKFTLEFPFTSPSHRLAYTNNIMLYARKDFTTHCSQISHGGSGLSHPPFNKSLSALQSAKWLSLAIPKTEGRGVLETRNEGSGGVFDVSPIKAEVR